MNAVIKRDRSIIPACDVDLEKFKDIIRETKDINEIGAYKISATLGLSAGLPKIVELARALTTKPLIYDHQKAGTDIPDTGEAFASMLKKCGIDAFIVFPLSGPVTQLSWIKSAQKIGLPVICGGYMTHDSFLASEGGYIEDSAVDRMYKCSATLGVIDYIVPGNKPEAIRRIRNLLKENGVDPILYSPGFIKQGGSLSEAASVAGPKWHAIVGRAIYEARDIQKAVKSLVASLKQ